jgi:hypothetical protein
MIVGSLTENWFDFVAALFFPASAAASVFAFACALFLASFFSNFMAYFSLYLKPRQARTLPRMIEHQHHE